MVDPSSASSSRSRFSDEELLVFGGLSNRQQHQHQHQPSMVSANNSGLSNVSGSSLWGNGGPSPSKIMKIMTPSKAGGGDHQYNPHGGDQHSGGGDGSLNSSGETVSAGFAEEDFSRPDDLRDFAFRIENKVLYLNATYLSILSPVFQAMTQGEFREAQEKTAELREKKYEDILELFRCIYPSPTTKPIDDKNVDLLLEMSREYQIADLKQRCSEFLKERFEKIKDLPNCAPRALELLIIGAKYDMSLLVSRCVPCVAQLCLETIDKHSRDGSIPVNVAAAIYQAKAYKYRDRSHPQVGPPNHVMGDRKFIVQGASRRKCDSCRVAGSSKTMDRCSRCERHLCEGCRSESCDKNVYNACKSCGKEVHFVGVEQDSCKCGYINWKSDLLKF